MVYVSPWQTSRHGGPGERVMRAPHRALVRFVEYAAPGAEGQKLGNHRLLDAGAGGALRDGCRCAPISTCVEKT